MTKNELDGGTAFPFALNCPGMSLRDYFAGQALTGLLASGCEPDDETIRLVFFAADQMLSKRRSWYTYEVN
jgi:hypothetical protein